MLGTPISGSTQDDDIAENAGRAGLLRRRARCPLGLQARARRERSVRLGDATTRATGSAATTAVRSELQTVNINPALAWRPVKWLSAGAGFQAQYVDGTLSNAIDFGTIGAAAAHPGLAVRGRQDGYARLHGDDWAYGWNAGVPSSSRSQGTRLGVAYRSEVDHTLRGDVNFTGDDAGIADLIRGATGAFTDTDASLNLTTPASLSFGVHQALTPRRGGHGARRSGPTGASSTS